MKFLFWGSSYQIGLSSILTEHVLALSRLKEVLVVTGESQQEEGLFTRLENADIPAIQIIGIDDHGQFAEKAARLAELIKRESPSHIMVHTNCSLL